MNTNTAPAASTGAVPIVLGIAAALLVAVVLSGRPWPLSGNERVALALLVLLGMAMCGSGGIGPAIAEGRWMAPLALVSIALGVAILVVAGAGLLGIALPGIAGAHQAFVVVAVLAAIKVLLTLLDRIF